MRYSVLLIGTFRSITILNWIDNWINFIDFVFYCFIWFKIVFIFAKSFYSSFPNPFEILYFENFLKFVFWKVLEFLNFFKSACLETLTFFLWPWELEPCLVRNWLGTHLITPLKLPCSEATVLYVNSKLLNR